MKLPTKYTIINFWQVYPISAQPNITLPRNIKISTADDIIIYYYDIQSEGGTRGTGYIIARINHLDFIVLHGRQSYYRRMSFMVGHLDFITLILKLKKYVIHISFKKYISDSLN